MIEPMTRVLAGDVEARQKATGVEVRSTDKAALAEILRVSHLGGDDAAGEERLSKRCCLHAALLVGTMRAGDKGTLPPASTLKPSVHTKLPGVPGSGSKLIWSPATVGRTASRSVASWRIGSVSVTMTAASGIPSLASAARICPAGVPRSTPTRMRLAASSASTKTVPRNPKAAGEAIANQRSSSAHSYSP